MQYRAIGLVRGKYVSSDEQFTRGTLITMEGTQLNAVLLGRVMSLVKNHLQLDREYLWVVYPRVTQGRLDQSLHVQIVGVWEPEILNRMEIGADPATSPSVVDSIPEPSDGYFSIRGEVVFVVPETENVIVKIQQSPRKKGEPEKAFKLKLQGNLPPRALGYFWDLEVQRQGHTLLIQHATSIAIVPPRKRVNRPKGDSGVPSKPRVNFRPVRRTVSTAVAPPRREAIPKPIKRNQSGEDSPSQNPL